VGEGGGGWGSGDLWGGGLCRKLNLAREMPIRKP